MTLDNILIKFKRGQMKGKSCSFDNCLRKSICKGMCDKHYRRAKKGNMYPKTRRMGTIEERFLMQFKKNDIDLCWLWEGDKRPNGKGILYGRFTIENGKGTSAHRYSYKFFNGDIPDNLFICHKCDTPLCVNPNHLFLGSHKENMKDMVNKNRSYKGRGEKKSISKLTNKQASEIRQSDDKRENLAKKYNVSLSCIARIKRNETYI